MIKQVTGGDECKWETRSKIPTINIALLSLDPRTGPPFRTVGVDNSMYAILEIGIA